MVGAPTPEPNLVENQDNYVSGSEDDFPENSDNVSPSNEIDDGESGVMPRSTSKPLPKSTSRKRQANEEYNLMKNLSVSIANRHKRRQQEKKSVNMLEAFGTYVTKALSEMDTKTCHFVQHKINNLIFQAQAGFLNQDMHPQSVHPQSQINYFRPVAQRDIAASPQSPSMYLDNNVQVSFRDEHRLNNSSSW